MLTPNQSTSILPCPAFHRPFAFKLFEVPINHGKVKLTIITTLKHKPQLNITNCRKIKYSKHHNFKPTYSHIKQYHQNQTLFKPNDKHQKTRAGFQFSPNQIGKLLKVQHNPSFDMPVQSSLQSSLLQPNTPRMGTWNPPTKTIKKPSKDPNFTKLPKTQLNS